MINATDPFRTAHDWIVRDAPCTGSALRLARLMLSLYNAQLFPFSAAECLASRDSAAELGMKMIQVYAARGETWELLRYAPKVIAARPDVVAEGRLMREARVRARSLPPREQEDEAPGGLASSSGSGSPRPY